MAEIETSGRGRPKGRTKQGEETRLHLYQIGLEMIEEVGFEKATLRKMAARAEVSPGLFYKYFPNKGALVLELHESLTTSLENTWETIDDGSWTQRAYETLKMSLESLKPHRKSLQSLIPVLVGGGGQGVFSEETKVTRLRVESLFYRSISESKNPPPQNIQIPISRLIYYCHLAVLLFWLLDQSDGQKATESLIKKIQGLLMPLSLLMKLPGARKTLLEFDKSLSEGLIGL